MPAFKRDSDFLKRNMMPNKRAAKIRKKIANSLREDDMVAAPPQEIAPESRGAWTRNAKAAVKSSLELAARGWTRW